MQQKSERIAESQPDELDLSVVQARTLCWLALLAEAHEEQARDAERRGDVEQEAAEDQHGSCLSGSGQRGSPGPPHREIAVRAGVLVGEQGVSSGASPTEGGGRAVIGQRPGSLLSSAGALVDQRARGKSRACRPSPGSAGRRLPASADRCGRSGC